MKSAAAVSVILAILLSWPTFALAQDTRTAPNIDQGDPLSSDPTDPGNLLREIEKRDARWAAAHSGRQARSDRSYKKR